jgi:hypothetical protein
MAHSVATQAAVLTALLTGQSIRETARQTGIPRSTVQRWQRQVPSFFKRPIIIDLVLRYVEECLETLSAHLAIFGNADWLSRQNARDAAILYKIVSDKLFTLLAALNE